MLLIEPGSQNLHWTMPGSGRLLEGIQPFDPAQPAGLANLPDFRHADVIGYVLPHGEAALTESITRLTTERLDGIETGLRFSDEVDRLALAAARAGLAQRPDAAHILLCETAFFANLPAAASTYALPFEYSTQGYRRYGGDGLCHQWVWQQIEASLGKPERTISLHLGDTPSLAALRAGQPVETSFGFASSEILPSATGCGDLDPSIVLDLCAAGQSPAAVRQALTAESGFQALTGQTIGFMGLQKGGEQTRLARELLDHGFIKAMGMALAVLGGADCIAFTCPDVLACAEVIRRLCNRLAFTGLRLLSAPRAQRGGWELSDQGSSMRVIGLEYHRPSTLRDLVVASGLTNPA